MTSPWTFDLQLPQTATIDCNLHKTMTDFGRYRLIYEPESSNDPGIEFTLGGDSTLTEMVTLCKDFLLANGYQFETLEAK